uniref:Ycf20-like protein n=1 Tax=Leersia perrieri TaxID=77586 RepID=A0A0D9W1I1_9ORYZ
MSALRLCDGAVKSSPCARNLAAAAPFCPRSRRGILPCHQNKQPTFRLLRASPSFRTKSSRQMQWSINAMADDSTDQSGDNNTRLFSVIQSFLSKLYGKLNKLRKGLPLKILFFLIGFYCATAFATVIGQTGDWDILSAGLAVAIVEGIGALMYRASFTFLGRIRKMITIFNYWKAGLTLGLFLDSFKYEMDEFLESCNPFNIDINIFSLW